MFTELQKPLWIVDSSLVQRASEHTKRRPWRRKIGMQNCVDQHEGHGVGKYCKYITTYDLQKWISEQCVFTVGKTILVISLVVRQPSLKKPQAKFV